MTTPTLGRWEPVPQNAAEAPTFSFDRYILSLSRLMNSATRRFFGQSLLAVVQRP